MAFPASSTWRSGTYIVPWGKSPPVFSGEVSGLAQGRDRPFASKVTLKGRYGDGYPREGDVRIPAKVWFCAHASS